MNQNEKSARLLEAVESPDLRVTGRIIAEMVLDAEEDTDEIAADFIENEVGRHDWVRNWEVIKRKTDPVQKVQSYLATYGLMANPDKIVNFIDNLAATNPGLWK